jgi:dienelactone hydrolase
MKKLQQLLVITTLIGPAASFAAGPFPSTRPLRMEGDIASKMIDGVDRFLLSELEQSIGRRAKHWTRDRTSAEAYDRSVAPNRQRLAEILGIRDSRVPGQSPQILATAGKPALVTRSGSVDVFAIEWPVFGGVNGEGLLLVPRHREPIADIVAIPDADQDPEQIAGLTAGVPAKSQFARRLAESGCRVIVPVLVNRQMKPRAAPGQSGRANLTNREYLYRSAFELGRHLAGYEIQKILACIDWFEIETDDGDPNVGVIGYGEGGLLALYAAALDTRVDAAGISGYFGSRQTIWREPIDRNVFGLLEQFGDAEIASLIAPRVFVADAFPGPELVLPSDGGAPSVLAPQEPEAIAKEKGRLLEMVGDLPSIDSPNEMAVSRWRIETVAGDDIFGEKTLTAFLAPFNGQIASATATAPDATLLTVDADGRQQRQVDQIDRYNQWLLRESPYVRDAFMERLNTDSLEDFERTIEPYRDYFRTEVIGSFDRELLAPNIRSRQAYDEPGWTGYEVVLDVFPDVFAYGILCVPKGIPSGDRRPVVVCQHGLEGRPQQVVTGDHRAYHDFAAKLAERGFVTFAPQNIYIFQDRFRTLQRKANPLKKTLFSIMVPQHQQIVNWLKSLPIVDPERIAFYGLSYGGKSAMRIPPLVSDYCLSICSADFNDWVKKCASNRARYSYVWTGEYEIFEWDLGSTFNYAEMAALIAPRPFMVERGHFDGVAPDEWVGYEYAKVRRLYQARLGIGDRTEIEWFVGPHTINGQGTFEFLQKHLDWP